MDNETKECIEHYQKDMVHQFHIMVEHVIDKVQIVAEGVASLSERVDRQGDELNQKIAETQSLMGTLYRQLDKKIDETANRLDKKIDETANRLDEKIERMGEKIERMDKKIERMDKKIERMDKKIEQMDKKIDKEVKGLRVDIIRVEGKVEMVAERIENHERVMHRL